MNFSKSLKRIAASAAAMFAAVLFLSVSAQAVEVEPGVPEYEPTDENLTGNLSAVGSDTMNNLMTMWGEELAKRHPGVNVSVEAKGSSTAPPALISGTAQLGQMSRKMKSSEINKFQNKYGYKPTRVVTAVDTLAVFLNKDNPVDCLALPELDAIFSSTRALGYPENINTWDQVGASGQFDGRRISLYGRNSASGTYGVFKEIALGGGDYRDTVKEQPGSASVVQGVTEDLYGIGYSGLGYNTSGVKAISLAKDTDSKCYEPNAKNALSGNYPLSRPLQFYVNKDPNGELNPLVKEFIKIALSQRGQEIVIKDGFFPLPADQIKNVRQQLGIE